MWRSAGKPRFGEICLSVNQSRLRFKSALKYCQQNETIMRANALAESMMNSDMNGFWKDVHTIIILKCLWQLKWTDVLETQKLPKCGNAIINPC